MTSTRSILVLASRNLLRNKRRSAVTILAATLGFAAVNLFGGFTSYMFVNLREAFIYGGGNGHLILYKEGYREQGASDPAQFLLPAEVHMKLQKLAHHDDRILLASGRLEVTGQLDTGDSYNIFVGRAVTPSHGRRFFEESKTMRRGYSYIAEGDELTDDNPYEIGIAFGVRRTLGLDIGSDAILMSRTVDGQLNVVDATVKNIFAAPNATLDSKLVKMPLELAQDLYQTDGVGSISLLLRDRKDIPKVERLVRETLAGDVENLRILRWNEESDMYRLTRKMFDMIFGIVFFILIIIVTMSVMNTMGMAILERTTEIGTLRAIGLKRSGVIRLFATEGALLGLAGSFLGAFTSFVIWLLVRLRDPSWTPPTLGREVPLEIRLETSYLLITAFFLVALTLLAAVVPARRAAKQGIVEALGHV